MFGSRVISVRSVANLVKPLFGKKVADSKTLSRSFGFVRTLATATPSLGFSRNAQELVSVLEEQIEAEKELINVGATPPKIPGFQISTRGAEVRLTKSYGTDEKICVFFNVNHSVNYDGDEYEPVEDEEEMTMSLPSFSVQVVKGDKRLCFEMDLAEMEDEQYCAVVEQFYVAPTAKEGEEAAVDMSIYSSTGKFIDPALNKLLFEHYLQERGITDEFCNHLVNFSTYYEHSQYVNLLNNIKRFIS